MGLWNLLSAQWQIALRDAKPILARISHELDLKVSLGLQIVPPMENVFAALPERPNSVKVVIVGQDPYPTFGHATGLAFSVPKGTNPLPPTLRNILRELAEDIPSKTAVEGDFSGWKEQGVLLLNRILTTEVGASLAHEHLGWQEVTLEIVRAVRRVNPGVIGVLWGKHAQSIAGEFQAERLIESVHPSPLSAYRGFFGSQPFSKVNQLLAGSQHSVIKW
jgi:uracil-DNA glycosylase